MKINIINIITMSLLAIVIFGFVYTSSNKATVSIEPIKKVVSNNEIVKSHSLNTTKPKTQKNNKLLNFPAPNQGCLACHDGIEPIRQHESEMMQQIYEKGKAVGDPNGCVICHKGNVNETKNKNQAHKDFIRFPGSVWVYDKTCGQCHEDHTYNLHRNLMQTEAGKIQGALWGWGATLEGSKVIYGNYDIDDPDGPEPRFGTEIYKAYMHKLAKKYPDNFPDKLIQLPEADISTIKEHPEQGVLTYLRSECLRCHVGVRGKQRRGDYRGMGCASCHIPYSDEGLYEGDDKQISKTEKGHLFRFY